MLTFGSFHNYTRVWPHQTSDGLYEDNLDLLKHADRLGFDMVWIPEHHLIHMMQSPSCLMTAAVVGQHVKCRIGTAICPLPYRHPLVWAGEIAAADRHLGGRLEVGVARGAYRYEFERFGLDFDRSHAQFEEGLLTMVKQLSSPKAIGNKGDFYNYDASFVWPRPVQQPHPPVWVGAMSERTARWAARNGFHAFDSPFFNPISRVAELVDAFRDEEAKAGYAPGTLRFGILRQCFVVENEAEMEEVLATSMMRQRMVSHLIDYGQKASETAYVAPDPVPNELSVKQVRDNALFGLPDEVYEKVLATEAAGVDHVLFSFDFGLPKQKISDCMSLFADKIMRRHRQERAETQRIAAAE
jgi:alkanesulfonate monooxygenase SsuD/methylene tetrahydromethanopterin reductase-like flavin-dependent oxidoreductase (luciferase family)